MGIVPHLRGRFAVNAKTEENKAVIRRFYDAWNSRQADAFDELVASNVVRHCEATPGLKAQSLDDIICKSVSINDIGGIW